MGKLADKVVIVIGGGADGPAAEGEDLPIGNGRATAIQCALEGARVVVADINLASARDTVDHILAQGGEAIAIACDVGNEDDCKAVVTAAGDKFGRLDGLVNNVATSDWTPIEESDPASFARVFQINVLGQFLTIKHALPHMRESGGSIVNVSSLAQVRWGGTNVSYDTTKAAIGGMTRNIAATCGPNVRANAVLPGTINSALLRRALDGRMPDHSKSVPLGRMGTSWEVAKAIVFLLSDDASFITGIDLIVDGGAGIVTPSLFEDD